MSFEAILQNVLYLVVLLALVKPLGGYMARVLEGQRTMLTPVFGPVERILYRLSGVDQQETGWKAYAVAMLAFNAVGMLAVYGLLRAQGLFPLNPQGFAGVAPDLAFNTAASFATNTNWQSYGGETTMSYLTQMMALTVQNFVSAATGIAVLAALTRGIARRSASTIGNFWADLTRSTLYILLPLAVVLSLFLVSQGVVQSLSPYQTATVMEPQAGADGQVTEQVLAMGPAASQIAIKQLGTNGGGFFNVNSAHPFENATPLSNFVQVLAILLIPAALCYTFGRMVGDTKQGWAILAAMVVIFVPLLLAAQAFEAGGNPQLTALGVDQATQGNMEGKDVRFGVGASTQWAAATTAASNGSVNSMHDSYTPLGGLIPMFLMQLSEVVFGGVGSGLYGMLVYVILAVFLAGLMVGRTPEYLGKKIGPFEMKMATVAVLVPPAVALLGTAAAVVHPVALAGLQDSGPHGFSELLYAFTSMGNNNGSAFAGLTANNWWVNTTGGLVMLMSRYWIAVPVLAIAGSLAAKQPVPPSLGTLPTHTPLFVGMLVGTVLLVGALTFVPALALGPVVEHLAMYAGTTY